MIGASFMSSSNLIGRESNAKISTMIRSKAIMLSRPDCLMYHLTVVNPMNAEKRLVNPNIDA